MFAGLRDDPFYFELAGFQTAVPYLQGAADGDLDAEGCPEVDLPTSRLLLTQLQGGDDPSDTFAGANVLALVVQVDKSLVEAGRPLLSVWASTHRAE